MSERANASFGIPYLYPYQRFVIANILERRDQIVILPTGAGKSLCFQLPASFLDGPTLVVYPLLSLIADQKRRLEESGMTPGILTGGMERVERERLYRMCADGSVRIVLTNPEMLTAGGAGSRLREVGFAHIVIDEAHCVSEWGDTFRPSYLELGNVLSGFRDTVLTAFTATASEDVMKRIAEVLFRDRPYRVVRANADRPNISYRVVRCESKSRTILSLVERMEKPLIVFTRSRKDAERTAFMLGRRLGDGNVRFYHAGLLKEEKGAVERWFFDSPDGILCSTSAYGMGVDKKNIRTVIHSHVPPSVEAYLQESGRAGRDGFPSTAILLHAVDDEAHGRRLERELDVKRYRRMLIYAGSDVCRRDFLLGLLGQEPEPCSGCDVCDGSAPCDGDPSFLRIRRFVSRYAGRFTVRETASILSGKKTLSIVEAGLHHLAEYGSLGGWDREDLEEAVRNLVEEGALADRPKRFSRNRRRTFLFPVRGKKKPPYSAAAASSKAFDEVKP